MNRVKLDADATKVVELLRDDGSAFALVWATHIELATSPGGVKRRVGEFVAACNATVAPILKAASALEAFGLLGTNESKA